MVNLLSVSIPKKIAVVLLIIIQVFFLNACEGINMEKTPEPMTYSLERIPESNWKKLSQRKIYFGHHSVGYNIIEGLSETIAENPEIKLNIVESENPFALTGPMFAHSRLGRNHYPISKVDAFVSLMNAGFGRKADIAFFKFCFVDIVAQSNVNQIFSQYNQQVEQLRRQYPNTRFVHVTTPLTIVQSGPKAFIKSIIGRPIDGYEDNIKRHLFNEMMRKHFRDKDPIFDLAQVESTQPDGKRSAFKKDGKIYFSLDPEYTSDGGHLNEKGRKIVAKALLVLLASLAEG
jgi:hypothetical protein